MPFYTQLSREQRYQIYALRKQQLSFAAIARTAVLSLLLPIAGSESCSENLSKTGGYEKPLTHTANGYMNCAY